MAFGSGGHAAVVPLAQPSGRGSPASVRDTLTGYAGGNLRPSDLGASAPYGLGEVHLLAFDPTSPAALEDGWSHGRVLEMIGRAWERRATIAFPHGAGERTDYRLDEIRRALDPNENFRPGLGASAVLLLLYSIFVGPVAFSRAMKKGKPLRALAWAPLLSAAAFGAIVLVGFASKGWRGRARHIALVEAGAGVTRGTVRRYRGLFSSETQSLTVRATDRWSVLDVASADSSSQTNAVLRVDRDGASLENLTSLPWQTVVIREDGFVDWKGAISVLANADGSADVVNRSGHRVRDLMVWLPGSGVSWFAELNDGARVRSSAGKQVLAPTARHHSTSGTRTVHAMGAHDIGFAATARSDGHLTKAWSPFETAATEAVDWWPDELPVAMGELVGVEKAPRDSGLALESEVVLFRVTGYGGTP